jgi:hypothetical protein
VGMNSADFLIDVAKALALIERADDYVALSAHGHQLVGGATLTCASDVPWQIQMKCSRCARVFWFDNLAWQTGGADRWALSKDSHGPAAALCVAGEIVAGSIFSAPRRKSPLQPIRG